MGSVKAGQRLVTKPEVVGQKKKKAMTRKRNGGGKKTEAEIEK